MTHWKITSVPFLMRICVPRVPNMLNYIFSTAYLAGLQWKATFLRARNKALCQWLSTMPVGGEKEQVWWKLLVACVVYFGNT